MSHCLRLILVCILITFPWAVVALQQHDPILLSPKPTEDVQERAVLVYFPGAAVPAEAYVNLLTKLQQELNSHDVLLSCAIVRFPKLWNTEIPPFWKTESLVARALDRLLLPPDDNDPSQPIFLGGHSLGAVLAQMVAYQNSTAYSGLVLHSSFVMDKYRNRPLPIPTLTLSGTRDGMNRLTYVAMQYKDLSEVYPEENMFAREAPTILVEGMNHMQLSGNHVNNFVKDTDMEATVPLEKVLKQTSTYTALFLLAHSNHHTTPLVEPLEQAILHSREHYFLPYIAAADEDQSGSTCVTAQRLHLEEQYSGEIVASSHDRLLSFTFSKPKGNDTIVTVESYATKALTVFGRSSVPKSFQSLHCKMVTKEQLTGVPARDYKTCSQLNRALFDKVLSNLPQHIQNDYSNAPTQWEFASSDIDYHSGMTWLSSDIVFSPEQENVVQVQCPRLKTEPGTGRYSGKLYCGLVSASRAYEHILIDAFRSHEPNDKSRFERISEYYFPSELPEPSG